MGVFSTVRLPKNLLGTTAMSKSIDSLELSSKVLTFSTTKHFPFSSAKCPKNDCNGTRTQNHLVHKRPLKHLAKLAKWLSCTVSTYLYGAFDCMFLSFHVRVSEWHHTLQLPECQGTPCSRQARYLKFKWGKRDIWSLAWGEGFLGVNDLLRSSYWYRHNSKVILNPLNANSTKGSNTLKQFVGWVCLTILWGCRWKS